MEEVHVEAAIRFALFSLTTRFEKADDGLGRLARISS
jgi:hypothetical protein